MTPKAGETKGEVCGSDLGSLSRDRRVRVVQFIGPFLLFFVFAGILLLLISRNDVLIILSLMLAYMVPPAGKETIIPAGIIALDFNFILVGLAVAYMDIITALFLVWNFDYARRIPFLGPWIENFEKKNANIMKEKRWLSNLAFLGVTLFVIFPFQGSGGVGASMLGRIIGMRPWRAFLAISVGAITGCLLIAYVSVTVGTKLFSALKTTEAKIAGILVFLLVILLFSYLHRKRKERKRARSPSCGESEE